MAKRPVPKDTFHWKPGDFIAYWMANGFSRVTHGYPDGAWQKTDLILNDETKKTVFGFGEKTLSEARKSRRISERTAERLSNFFLAELLHEMNSASRDADEAREQHAEWRKLFFAAVARHRSRNKPTSDSEQPEAVEESYINFKRLLDEHVTPSSCAQYLREFYREGLEGLEGYKPYDLRVEDHRVESSMLISTSPTLQNFELSGTRYSGPSGLDLINEKSQAETAVPAEVDAVRKSLLDRTQKRLKFDKVRLWSSPTYRLDRVSEDATDPQFAFSLCDFLDDYRWMSGLLEDELKETLVDPGKLTTRGANKLRKGILPSIASILDLEGRVCCGGVEVTTAFQRDDDFLIPLQKRSFLVGDGQGSLATVPKGVLQPISNDPQNVDPICSVWVEMFEELYFGEEVQFKAGSPDWDFWRSYPKAQAVNYLMDSPSKCDIVGTSFGFNLMSGNFEFGCLITVEDKKFFPENKIDHDWEAKGFTYLSTKDIPEIRKALTGTSPGLVNEAIPSLARGLLTLKKRFPDYVELPDMEEL